MRGIEVMQFIKKIVIAIITLESRIIVAKYKPFIVAVTGSVGKTSTKDAVYSVLKHTSRFARKSEKSMNSEIGLPLTILGVPNAWKSASGWFRNVLQGLELIMWRAEYPDCLILEIGADHPGDIKKVVKWLKPDISILTKISQTPVHVEFFSSPEEVFEEKISLVRATKKGGTSIIFADDEKVAKLGDELSKKGIGVVSYGSIEGAMVRGSDVSMSFSGEPKVVTGISFRLNIKNGSAIVNVHNVLGNTYIYPLLAAAAVGQVKGLALTDIVKYIDGYEAPHGRMNIVPGLSDSTIIDDSYNSSPDAAMSALEALAQVECSGRKIVAFGDMMELGKYASDEHHRVGERIAQVASVLITVGPRSRLALVDGAVKAGMNPVNIHSFDTSEEAGKYAASVVGVGDIVLVKGSQSMRMERVSYILLRDPGRASELLVRQEREWLDKK